MLEFQRDGFTMVIKLADLLRELKSFNVFPELGRPVLGFQTYRLLGPDHKMIVSVTPAFVDHKGDEYILEVQYENCMAAVQDHLTCPPVMFPSSQMSPNRIIPFRK